MEHFESRGQGKALCGSLEMLWKGRERLLCHSRGSSPPPAASGVSRWPSARTLGTLWAGLQLACSLESQQGPSLVLR